MSDMLISITVSLVRVRKIDGRVRVLVLYVTCARCTSFAFPRVGCDGTYKRKAPESQHDPPRGSDTMNAPTAPARKPASNAQLDGAAAAALSVVAFGICGSGTLLLLNGETLRHLPYPGLVACAQLVFTLDFLGAGELLGVLQVDPVRAKFVTPYLSYSVLFRCVRSSLFAFLGLSCVATSHSFLPLASLQ
jgi:hypothetical protein